MLDVLQESMYVYSSTFFRVSDFDHHQKSHPESQTCGRMDSRILMYTAYSALHCVPKSTDDSNDPSLFQTTKTNSASELEPAA